MDIGDSFNGSKMAWAVKVTCQLNLVLGLWLMLHIESPSHAFMICNGETLPPSWREYQKS